jgi:hypothetical protein
VRDHTSCFTAGDYFLLPEQKVFLSGCIFTSLHKTCPAGVTFSSGFGRMVKQIPWAKLITWHNVVKPRAAQSKSHPGTAIWFF